MKTLDDEYEKNIGQFHGSESDLDDIDSAKGFADLSRRWASEDYGTSVDGVEYSSKHYATDSKESSEVSLEAAEISVNASNVATDGATNAKQSEDNAKVSEDNAKQSEDNIYALVDGIDDVVDAAIESVVNEGNTQVTRVTGVGDTQVNRVVIEGRDQTQAVNDAGEQQIDLVVGEGDSQVSRLDSHAGGLSSTLTNEANVHIENIENIGEVVEQDLIRTGDIQVLRVRNEGDIQAGRAEAEADRAEAEADRAEAAAIDLDNAPRYHGYFSPDIGYPPPPEQRIPYQWFCTEDGTAGGIAWSEGDMLYYAPHPTNPDGEMGQYFRVAGELAAGGDPQPIEIPDDLIMQVDKKIYFRDAGGRLVQALSLDGNDDLLLGEMTPNLESGEGTKAINALGLAAVELYHVEEQDASGAPTVFHLILSEKNGVTLIAFDAHVNNQNNPHSVTAAQVGAAPASHVTDETNPHAVTAAQAGAAPASHVTDETNPHAVTAAQVGAATTGALAAHVGDTENPHEVTPVQIGAATSAALTAHTGDTENPHAVTAAQAGAAPASHVTDETNPHSVTAAQVGAAPASHEHTMAAITDLSPGTIARTNAAINCTADVVAFSGAMNEQEELIKSFTEGGVDSYTALSKAVEVLMELKGEVDDIKTRLISVGA
ncbi:hypothetical protein VCHA53O463_110114 [Vibrio chagasii]|nr:hypothetical protein VCHA35P150_20439 [Vibrio chagasii]CAH6906130.1 hypothetical protein VCHA56P515_100048 [Vibrio chagasii]CAH6968834.1 hypothetical protein VCHA53O463_110114 [Vibrio chagasii]CAH7386284.1 hypothetical protein VCHA53O464_20029 [Vibrio chagasii]